MKLILKFLVILILTLILSGCGKDNSAPPPPRAQSDLVTELFSSLREHNYPLAAQKIKKLRMLNDKDYFLASIEYQINVDSGFIKAQNLLNDGKVKQASESINSTIDKYGSQDQLTEAKVKLETLTDIQKLSEKIIKGKTSSHIALATGELNRIIAKHKFANPLKPFAEYSLDRARKMMTTEEIMSIQDLIADIDIARIADPSIASTMYAELKLEDNDVETVKAYENMLSYNWNKPIESLDRFNEIQYFRDAISSNKAERDKIFTIFVSLPPANFTGMLIRAFVLKSVGYSKEGNALAKLVESTLQLNTKQTSTWFRISPAQITDFYSINPFVLYPFFVYCDSQSDDV